MRCNVRMYVCGQVITLNEKKGKVFLIFTALLVHQVNPTPTGSGGLRLKTRILAHSVCLSKENGENSYICEMWWLSPLY